jgi:hypothetical protein
MPLPAPRRTSWASFLLLLLWHRQLDFAGGSAVPNWEAWRANSHFQGPAEARGGGACATDDDCSLLGACAAAADKAGTTCICDAGFMGSHCDKLDLLPSNASWGYVDPERASWGGMILRHNDRYHLVASFLENKCDLTNYGTNSAVLRASAETAHGPFKFEERILPAFHHGAHIVHDAASGLFAVFADGKDIPGQLVHNCRAGSRTSAGMPGQHPQPTAHHGLYAYGESPHDQIVVATSPSL